MSMDALKMEITNFKSMMLRVETTNCCNFKCSFCTHEKMTRKQGFMSREVFEKTINEAVELGIQALEIRSFGEPLLDNSLEEEIEYASKRGIKYIGFTTNGFLLTPKRYLLLCKTPLDRISFSISPKREYEITRGVDFDIIMNNLEGIKEYNHIVPIIAHIIATDISTPKECLRLEYELTRMGYKWERDTIHNWAEGSCDSNCKNEPCLRLWKTITVNWDGTCPLCCLDYDAKKIMGDVRKTHLRNVINSDRYQEMRQRHLNADYPKICQQCNYLEV